MNWAGFLQKLRMKKFEDVFKRWKRKELSQRQAAFLLDVSDRTFRRYVARYTKEGIEGLADRRIGRRSHLRASDEEVRQVRDLYRDRYQGRNVKHFYEVYKERHGGKRSYGWVKNCLYKAGLARKPRREETHRLMRERKPAAGMMLHQDASTHRWTEGKKMDLVVTMDDATSEIYNAFLVDQEGTKSSFRGVLETLRSKGLFFSLYTDRGSHYWTTPAAGGPVDKDNPTQFGRAMKELGIKMIPAYSPQARGRSERMFGILQDRLPQELQENKITDIDEANEYIAKIFLPSINRNVMKRPKLKESAFVPLLDVDLDEILCLKDERKVGNDNCVSYNGLRLQIPPVSDRYHFVKARVEVREYLDGTMAIYHGRRRVGSYDLKGRLREEGGKKPKIPVAGARSFTSASSSYAL